MMKLCKPIVILVCFVLWVNGAIYGQKNLTSDHLGIENGLSNSAVRSFYQDHQGFMWIGTNDGLNRYDGYEFKIYRNRTADTGSIIQNWINVIAEDQSQNLWVGTHGGVSIYNRLTENFSSLSYLPQNKRTPEKLIKDVEDIKFDKQGTAYLKVTGEGLVVFKKGSPKHGFVVPCSTAGKNYHVQALALSPAQKLWVTVAGVGLCAYDDSSKQLKPVSRQYLNATRMLFHRDLLWLAGIDGIDSYDITGKTSGRHFSYPTA
jgi:ligand-binding sensor domain-containing protein